MFLGNLTEKERAAFICLVENEIKADGITTETEIFALSNLTKELHVKDKKGKLSLEESYRILTDLDESSRRGVYIELYSVAMAEKTFGSSEKDFLKTVAQQIKLPADFPPKAEGWLSEYFGVLQKGIDLVSKIGK